MWHDTIKAFPSPRVVGRIIPAFRFPAERGAALIVTGAGREQRPVTVPGHVDRIETDLCSTAAAQRVRPADMGNRTVPLDVTISHSGAGRWSASVSARKPVFPIGRPVIANFGGAGAQECTTGRSDTRYRIETTMDLSPC